MGGAIAFGILIVFLWVSHYLERLSDVAIAAYFVLAVAASLILKISYSGHGVVCAPPIVASILVVFHSGIASMDVPRPPI